MDISFNLEVLGQIKYSFTQFASRPAFCIGNSFYTYRALAQRVASIRRSIQDCFSGSSSMHHIVAVCIRDNIDTYASILALWLEGDAYVPLNPLHPKERNLGIINQVGIRYVIDSSLDPTSFDNCRLINTYQIEDAECELEEYGHVSDDSLAYILFTSGSTGIPKGVCITRGNVAAFMDSFWKTGISVFPDDRCLQCFDLTFDVSIQSFLVALTKGACVYTVPYGQVKYLYVARLIQEQGITFGAMAPSMLTYLRPYFNELDASSLRVCILTAEACTIDLLEAWSRCACNAELYDFYGPTESTIYCSYYRFARGGNNLSFNGVVSIGKPFVHVRAYILDDAGNELLGGQKGELCIAGEQLTPGYWNSPEKNESSFFTKLINGEEHRFYHTGDVCCWDESGNIMYINRKDQQVKIQGFRVELSELEYHTREFYDNNRRVLAMSFDGTSGLTEIALFVETQPENPESLLNYLRSKMPTYMIPSKIIYMPIFPLNSSDKVDRNRLKTELVQ